MTDALTTEKTVGDIAAENPAAASVFEKYGIDFCCGGKRPLAEACRAQGASPEDVARDLAATLAEKQATTNWTAAPLSALIDHIVTTHHSYLNEELPLLRNRVQKVIDAHGGRFPYLAQVAEVFGALSAELEGHLMKEETVLFPFIRKMEEAQGSGRSPAPSCFGTVQNPIRMMEHEHDNAGEALARLRQLTGDYKVPEDVCNTFRALYVGLERMERDLHTHIHLENNILFPRAARLEARLRAA